MLPVHQIYQLLFNGMDLMKAVVSIEQIAVLDIIMDLLGW